MVSTKRQLRVRKRGLVLLAVAVGAFSFLVVTQFLSPAGQGVTSITGDRMTANILVSGDITTKCSTTGAYFNDPGASRGGGSRLGGECNIWRRTPFDLTRDLVAALLGTVIARAIALLAWKPGEPNRGNRVTILLGLTAIVITSRSHQSVLYFWAIDGGWVKSATIPGALETVSEWVFLAAFGAFIVPVSYWIEDISGKGL